MMEAISFGNCAILIEKFHLIYHF